MPDTISSNVSIFLLSISNTIHANLIFAYFVNVRLSGLVAFPWFISFSVFKEGIHPIEQEQLAMIHAFCGAFGQFLFLCITPYSVPCVKVVAVSAILFYFHADHPIFASAASASSRVRKTVSPRHKSILSCLVVCPTNGESHL